MEPELEPANDNQPPKMQADNDNDPLAEGSADLPATGTD
jgi:hypothetical protein